MKAPPELRIYLGEGGVVDRVRALLAPVEGPREPISRAFSMAQLGRALPDVAPDHLTVALAVLLVQGDAHVIRDGEVLRYCGGRDPESVG